MSEISVKDRIRDRRRNAVDPEQYLRDIGAIHEVGGTEELSFTPEFAAKVDDHIAAFRETDIEVTDIARLFGVPEEYASVADRDYIAYKVIHTVHNWPSEGALIFDLAADAAIREVADDWEETVPDDQRHRIAKGLRSFQEECFFCAGEIVFGDDTVLSCCSETRVLTLHCEDCDRRYLEFATEEPAEDEVGSATLDGRPHV